MRNPVRIQIQTAGEGSESSGSSSNELVEERLGGYIVSLQGIEETTAKKNLTSDFC